MGHLLLLGRAMPRWAILRWVLAVTVITGFTSPGEADARGTGEARETLVESRLNSLRADGEALRGFLEEMPKGADLHSHLSGAVTTERLIEWGAADGLCVDSSTFVAMPPPCAQGAVPIAGALSDPALYEDVLGAWSMEGFQGTLLEAHQHFFDTFSNFVAILTDA